MATSTHLATVADVNDLSTYTSASFTPAASALLVVGFMGSGVSGVSGSAAVTSSANGITFSRIRTATRASVDDVHLFVADQLVPASPVAMTVSMAPGAAATGCIGWVHAIVGLTRAGATAVRGSAGSANAAAVAPTSSLPAAALTANLVATYTWNATNPAGMTPPTSFTEPVIDVGYATPVRGGSYAVRASGHTAAAVTWGSTSATASANIAVEFDTSAAPAEARVNRQQTNRSNPAHYRSYTF